MKVYIITYRYIADKERGIWTADRVQPEGFTTLREAQDYIRRKSPNAVRCTNFYFQTDNFEEYYIREVTIKEAK